MTPQQRTMLFSIFAQLAKARAWGPAQREIERERITTAALGFARSWSDCGNGEVDRLKQRLLAELHPDNLAAQRAEVAVQNEDAGERARLLWRVEQEMARTGFTESYVKVLCRDLYDRVDWRDLPLLELLNLRDVVIARARAKARTPEQQQRRKERIAKARAAVQRARDAQAAMEQDARAVIDQPF